ncbi:Kif9, partial [Symbiodinium sp. CCMP2456]
HSAHSNPMRCRMPEPHSFTRLRSWQLQRAGVTRRPAWQYRPGRVVAWPSGPGPPALAPWMLLPGTAARPCVAKGRGSGPFRSSGRRPKDESAALRPLPEAMELSACPIHLPESASSKATRLCRLRRQSEPGVPMS